MGLDDVNSDGTDYVKEERLMADGSGIPDEPYAANTPLDRAFPDSPNANVIAALISEPDQELTESDLEQLSGVEDAGEHAEYLAEELEIVEENDGMYSLNTNHDGVRELAEFERSVIKEDYSKQ